MQQTETGYDGPQWNIHEIIEKQNLEVCFQQIVSVSRKTVTGLEGLIHGINPKNNEIISPSALFEAAFVEGITLQFDRLCRSKVLEAYAGLYKQFGRKLLFLNVDASILEKGIGSDYLIGQIRDAKINPRNIVVEINEVKSQDNVTLKKFTDTYRDYGCMIALDDVGTGFSNMDRILIVKPDIIKIDISLVRNIHVDYYKQEIVQSLVNLCSKTGALVVAEGIETQDEAIQVMKLGGHMLQGYYVARPTKARGAELFSNDAVESLSREFNDRVKTQIREDRQRNRRISSVACRCAQCLKASEKGMYDNILYEFLKQHSQVECAYILDKQGMQVGKTVCILNEKQKKSLIFYSAQTGADHSMKKYFYPLVSANLKSYITEPYISLATGRQCITASRSFKGGDGSAYILCLDFKCETPQGEAEYMMELMHHTQMPKYDKKPPEYLHRMISRMNKELYTDSLTTVFNRRYIEEQMPIDIADAAGSGQPVSVLLCDIDLFKEVNDTYGHPAGDKVLRDFVRVAAGCIRRDSDWIARYGGEEFLIVLLNSDETVAQRVAEKIRAAVEKEEFFYKRHRIPLTVSIGSNTVRSGKASYEDAIEIADKNLYIAKNSGRNKIVGGLPQQECAASKAL